MIYGDDEGLAFMDDDLSRYKELERDKPQRRREEINEEPPPLYTILAGKVVSIQDYGCFISLEGYKRQGKETWYIVDSNNTEGLCHKTQIAKQKISGKEEIRGVVEVGDKVYVKVISLVEF